MVAVDLRERGDKIELVIDKSVLNIESLYTFLDEIKSESLAKNIEFDEKILDIADEISRDWWTKNRERLIK